MFLIVVQVLVVSYVSFSSASYAPSSFKEELSLYWTKFWSISCHMTPPTLSRSRRSVDLPDTGNPQELFDYLLPLANVNPEDIDGGEGSRSIPGPSSWLDDVADLWEQECRRRRSQARESSPPLKTKRSVNKKKNITRRRRSNVRHEGIRREDIISRDNYPGNVSYVYAYNSLKAAEPTVDTTTSTSVVVGENDEVVDVEEEDVAYDDDDDDDKDSGDDEDEQDEDQDEDGEIDKESYDKNEETTTQKSQPSDEEKKKNTKDAKGKDPEEEEEDDEEEEEETTTEVVPAATAAPPPALSVIPADSGSEYFSSYGGDVEYFFPLIAFGIPFDGIITVLGYHGFKGLSTY